MVNMSSGVLPQAERASGHAAGSVLYGLAVVLMIGILVGLVLAYGGRAYFNAELAEREPAGLADTHAITIGAQRYGIPAGLLTDPAQRRDGFAERIDLSMLLPLAKGGQLSSVDISLMPRGRARASAALLDSVYVHQFANEQLSGPVGLIGKPLDLDAGTRGETIWYDPLNANPFVAKCMAPIASNNQARTCLRVLTLSDRNTVVVSFEPAVLDNWRQFDAGIETAIAGLRQ